MFGKKEKANGNDVKESGSSKPQPANEQEELRNNLAGVRKKIVVLSGKGGVGKSTVAVNLAVAIAKTGARVGLLDVDVHGPSVPTMLGLQGEPLSADSSGKIIPLVYGDSLKVLSVGFMLQNKEDAVIWRGPLKYGIIKQFLKDVVWGELDYLIIDSPPGTGDEPLSVCQLIENPEGAVIVTTPQDVALIDVMKSISFCRQLNMPVIGVIENMSGFTCPHCGTTIGIFKGGGALKMTVDMRVPFLGSIPIESRIAIRSDEGRPFVTDGEERSAANGAFDDIVGKIMKYDGGKI
ncbi:MAG TPA: Mrp/NBP35 family ATP-binding protein [Spirochaetota bacterium]|nr:Mrp/NBP35 family ATP-binding protein [Spirochaetota bacterium]OPZ39038.1 MAG: Septum site-determining protein MinD [Spirochaetes bacterium ADurb.BinA120]HNU91122.1 Mrp/NBP35 family ATP-binding protein [Spirochaetota bacterium]HPV96210.1 Mrp/NBP35 family ATP-binding protein [Spirochaetota bacterium]